jgi:hypothetical protein
MQRTLKTYFQRWKFHHPSTQDFQTVLESVTRKSWKTFFDSYVYGGLMLDYTVDNIHINKANENGQITFISEVLIRKRGGPFPNVPIQFHFSDGTTVDKVWNSESSDILYKLAHTAPIDWVRIDPEHNLLMENKHINNFMKTTIDPAATIRWNTSFVKIIETLFNWVSW